MILTKEVEIVINRKNYLFYIGLGFDVLIGQKILIPVEYLSKGSNIKIDVRCDFCGLEKNLSYKNYNKSLKVGSEYSCSQKCSYKKKSKILFEESGITNIFQSDVIKEKIKKSNLLKFGVDSYIKTDEFKEKSKKTILEKYGFENSMKNDEVKAKVKNTSLEKFGGIGFASSEISDKIKKSNLTNFGVEFPCQLDEIKDKIKSTSLEKFGGIGFASDEIREKIKETTFKKFGVSSNTKSEKFRKEYYTLSKDLNYIEYSGDKISIFSCDKGHTFSIHKNNYFARKSSDVNICTICNPIGETKSIKEKELCEFIKSFNTNVISSYRDGREIDIFLPDLSLGFEFNGLYFHSDIFKQKNYHLEKLIYFQEKKIRIIHIWEDDWDLRKEIIKSQIKNFIGVSKKIFARKCCVKEISNSDSNKFLNSNHIQGSYGGAKICLGLFFDNDLVSVMTFDQFEGRKKMSDNNWNLSRFCNKLDFSVVGGASKLLSYFIKNYSPVRVISYADRNWSNGSLYEKLGFQKIQEGLPDYKYLHKGERVHKSNFRKSITGISEKELNLSKIWDCGKIKYEKLLKYLPENF